MTVYVDSRGRIVLPKSVRESLGLRPGDSVSYVVKGDSLVLRKAERV